MLPLLLSDAARISEEGRHQKTGKKLFCSLLHSASKYRAAIVCQANYCVSGPVV